MALKGNVDCAHTLTFGNEEDTVRETKEVIRKAAHGNQLATAEVAARVLATAGEAHQGQVLQLWFELFSYRYQQAVHQINQGREDAQARLHAYLEQSR